MRSSRILTRVLLVGFGVLLALLIAEIGLRVLYASLPQTLQIALRDVRLTPFTDQRLAPPPLWQADRDYLTLVRPGAENLMQAGSPTVIFPVSSYAWWGGRVGFRSPPPADGVVSAVALGDSHTFCFTAESACWVTLLSRALNQPLYNLGQPVTGSVSHARRFVDFVAKPALGLKQPRLVIWQFYGNDYNDDYGLAVLNASHKTPYAEATASALPGTGSSWLRDHSIVYALLDALLRRDPGADLFVDPHRVIAQGVDIRFGQRYIRDSFDMTQPRNLEGEQLSQQAILQTKLLVAQNGGAFVMLLMPTKEEVYRRLTEPMLGKDALNAIAAPRLRMLAFCAAHELTCFDLLPGLQAAAEQNQQVFFPTDTHLNALGNQIVADLVAGFLRGSGLSGGS
jgi:SGNH hydrolase-like domain, acetyltransferase AlgX